VRAHGGPVGFFADAGGGQHGIVQGAGGTVHIGSALGELKLDIQKVTHGLAHGEANGTTTAGSKQSIWSNGDLMPGNGVAKNYNQGNNGSASGAGSANGAGAGNGSAGGIANGLGNGGLNGLLNGNGNVNANGIGANNTNGNGLKNGHNKI